MLLKTLRPDARYFQIVFQLVFLCYGLAWLGWESAWLHDAISIAGCLFFHYVFASLLGKKWLPLAGARGIRCWGLSVLISALSLCLLLKTNHWTASLLAAFLTVASKYIFHYRQKHLFNPSAFGIVATILITQDAWLSPGQWGSNAVIFFFVVTLGTIVVTRVQKLDASLAFLGTYLALLCWRQLLVLHWPADHFFHSSATGSLLLFGFFMISDPRTSPNHPVARIFWAILIAIASFYWSAFRWKYNTPVWVLVAATPLVPLLDAMFRAATFRWTPALPSASFCSTIKIFIMKPFTKKIAASVLLVAFAGQQALAFCGFYVSKADGTLKNKTSQVILVRDGDRTVVTMYNDFQGDFRDFAMVVPVPVVLQRSDIKVVDQQIFTTLNEYSKPRLVEYFDENPCASYEMKDMLQGRAGIALNEVTVMGYGTRAKKLGVRVEAKYLVGEYDILILSAKESAGLRTWLEENGYRIPAGADEVLKPYIESKLKFFVVKVNEAEKKRLPGNFLRPIQISFASPKFMLPIRLGMANADGDQDMLVYAFARTGRIECTNYRTVALPTGRNIPLFVQGNFGNFYANLFRHQWQIEGRSVAMLEYAWNVSPGNYLKCDPCIAASPSAQDLLQAGVWWAGSGAGDNDQVYFTRLHVRYNRNSFPQDLMFQLTPNTENYQARYVVTHPAAGDFNCEAGRNYLAALKQRRQQEMQMLVSLTGKDYSDWDVVMKPEERSIPADVSYRAAAIAARQQKKGTGLVFAAVGLLGLASWVSWRRRRN